ncbi:hypothetical protein MMC20_004341 [Loxospora ochrophaea]|nr:hypothetical protein [Loxospora ochrophaea]
MYSTFRLFLAAAITARSISASPLDLNGIADKSAVASGSTPASATTPGVVVQYSSNGPLANMTSTTTNATHGDLGLCVELMGELFEELIINDSVSALPSPISGSVPSSTPKILIDGHPKAGKLAPFALKNLTTVNENSTATTSGCEKAFRELLKELLEECKKGGVGSLTSAPLPVGTATNNKQYHR